MYKLLFVFTALVLLSAPVMAGFLDDLESAIETAAEDIEGAVESASDENASEGDLWDQVRFQWGKYAGPDNVQFIEHDVTCDGVTDYVASHLSQDNPDGPFFHVMVVTRDGGELTSENIPLALDGSQDGLCEPMGETQIDVEIEHWDEGQLDAALGSWEGICTEAIRIDDGMCDAPRYFWLTGERDEQHPRLMSFRN